MAGTDANNAFDIYAPTSPGSKGQLVIATDSGTPGWTNQSNVIAGGLTTNAGSTTNPVYFTGGIPTKCSFKVNNGTAGALTYYSAKDTISSYPSQLGSST
jgi:hypothetical protein